MKNYIAETFIKSRADFEKQSALRNQALSFPAGVTEITDIPYCDSNDSAHRLDIFYPTDTKEELLPVIVNVHGGGLILGSKEFNRFFCALLSKAGFLVFSMEYRLVPDVTVFEQFTDYSRALDSIEHRIPEYHGDSSHVYVVADSGGAYIATYATAMQKSSRLAKAANVIPAHLNINALGLISGMFYTTKFDKIGLFLSPYLYGKNYKKGAFAPYTNPEHEDIVKYLPPCYLVTSHNDMLQRYTLNFEKALARNGMEHKLTNYPQGKKLTHAFSVFRPFEKESLEQIDDMLTYLKKF